MSLNGKVENSIANNDVEEGFFFIALLSSCIVLPQVKEKKNCMIQVSIQLMVILYYLLDSIFV